MTERVVATMRTVTSRRRERRGSAEKQMAIRGLDLAITVALLPVAIVVGVCVALLVFVDSPGGIFFRSPRIGRNGRPFSMLKFRTMRTDLSGPSLSVRGDVRYTPIGRWLAASRLDELPQLYNVLRGEMRLVGPRPELAEFVDSHIDAYRSILAVPPGLTGPTQLLFSQEGQQLAEVEDRLQYYRDELMPLKLEVDLAYTQTRTTRGDLMILLRTLLLPMNRSYLRVVAFRGSALAKRTRGSIVPVFARALAVVALIAAFAAQS